MHKIVIAVILVMLSCGCTKKETATVIQFSSWGSKSEIDILKPILNDFEKENPNIKVDFMHIPQNYFQKIHLLFASNTAPDVIFLNNHYLPIYANAGLLEDLSDSELITKKFYNKSIEALSYNNKIYAIPRDISNLVVYYNKNLFDKNNLNYPNKETTFSDFLELALKLTNKEKGIYGVSFEEDPLFYLPYLMSEGGGILADDLKTNILTTPESIQGITFYSNLRNKYNVAPKRNENASATMAQMFLQGKIAMHISGRWLVPKYRESAHFDWDITQFPKGTKGSIVPLDASGWAISSKSTKKNEAKLLIKYLSSKESLDKFSESGLIVPARIDSANSEYFLDKLKPKNAKVFLDIIETSKPTPVNVNYNEILDKTKQELEPIFNPNI
ncbi:sugar ABC transporter substrate-binding protein [bacterium]|nr:sugar ABC transporter substrate-binding protein [bacterium]